MTELYAMQKADSECYQQAVNTAQNTVCQCLRNAGVQYVYSIRVWYYISNPFTDSPILNVLHY
jgi:hypothetical protein